MQFKQQIYTKIAKIKIKTLQKYQEKEEIKKQRIIVIKKFA